MFDPEMILTMVQQGRGDPSWRVYYAHSSPLASAIILGLFAFFFIGVCEFIATGVLLANGVFGTATPSLNPFQILIGFGAIGLVIPAIAAIAVAVFTKNKVSQTKDSILVILPEGVVECKGYSNPSRRSWQVLDYADVANIQLKVWTSSSSETSSATAYFSLDIQKRNGEQQRWSIDSRYGSPEMIAQSIIESHAQYVALRPQALGTQQR